MGRKISILILSLCLLLGMAPSAAQAADPPPAADEGEAELVLDKWVEDNGDGTFQLVMESYATGSDGTIVPKPTPVDIVLVLDESGSMKDVLVQGCNNKNGIDVHVKPEGHLAQGATAAHPGTELFVGHKVFPEPSDESKKIDTKKSYTIVYPGDGTTRTVTYCQTCGNWYSNEDHNEHYHLAKWIPFTVENETPTNENSGDKTGRWTCHVQFYEQCEPDRQGGPAGGPAHIPDQPVQEFQAGGQGACPQPGGRHRLRRGRVLHLFKRASGSVGHELQHGKGIP